MAITVTSLGAVQSSSSASSSTLTMGQAFNAGDIIHLFITCGSAQTVSSIGGTLGVTFSPVADSITDAGGASFRAVHVVGLVPMGGKATGLTVQVNFSAATTQRGVLGTVVTGGFLASSSDYAAHATGTGSASSAPVGTFGTAPDYDSGVVIAAVCNDGVFTGTATGGFTETQDQQVGTNKRVQINHKILASGMAAFTSYTASLSGSATQSVVMLLAIRDAVPSNRYAAIGQAVTSAAGAANLDVPTFIECPVGSLVVVRTAINFNTPVTGITDDAGNTYTQRSIAARASMHCDLWDTTVTTLRPVGDTLHIATAGGVAYVADAVMIPNPGAIDAAATPITGVSTAALFASFTPATANEVAFYLSGHGNANVTTPDTTNGFVEDADQASGAGVRGEGQTKLITSTSSFAATSTWVSSAAFAAVMVVYKFSGGGSTTPQTVSASSTTSASLINMTNKTVGVSITQALILLNQAIKLLTSSSTSVASLLNMARKILGASITNSVVATPIKIILQTLSASGTNAVSLAKSALIRVSTSTGNTASMVRLNRINVPLAVQNAVSRTLLVAKSLSVSLGSTASVANIKVILVSLSVSITNAVSMVRQVSKTVLVQCSNIPGMLKSTLKSISSTAPNAPSLSRSISKALTATSGSSVSISKRAAKLITSTASSLLSGTQQFIAGGTTFFKTLSASATFSALVSGQNIGTAIYRGVRTYFVAVRTRLSALTPLRSRQAHLDHVEKDSKLTPAKHEAAMRPKNERRSDLK